jgi:hypothetical protein
MPMGRAEAVTRDGWAVGRLLTGLLVGAAVALAGCGGGALRPAYTPEELARECVRTGGWWGAHVAGGYCEYESPGFL